MQSRWCKMVRLEVLSLGLKGCKNNTRHPQISEIFTFLDGLKTIPKHSHILWFIIRQSNPSLLELCGFQTPCFLSNSWGQTIGGYVESDTYISLM